jgi:hypothetical protein
MSLLVDPKNGNVLDIPENEVANAQQSMGLVPATPEQIAWLDRQKAEAEKGFGEKIGDAGGALTTGLMRTAQELGKLRVDDSQGTPFEQAAIEHRQKVAGILDAPETAHREEAHPLAAGIGRTIPYLGVSGVAGASSRALGASPLAAGAAGLLTESAVVGAGEEAVASTQEGREFDFANAAEQAAYDALFSAAGEVATRVGGFLLFGTGKTVSKNVGRGLNWGELEGAVAPIVRDDVRFDSPLLEAETRSRRTAAAASPDMPPGPERDEMLRNAAPDLNRRVTTEAGDLFDSTVRQARESVAATDDDLIARRVDEMIPKTSPAQTSWSADATRKFDDMRTALAKTEDPAAAPFVQRAVQIVDEAVAAIDGSGDASAWFRASAAARDRLDSLSDDIATSELPAAHRAQLIVDDARGYLGRSLTDRSLFGAAAEMHAGLHGAARDKIATAVRGAGGDLRARLGEFVSADAAARSRLRGPLERAVEGFEELANAHEKFGTATPKTIETLRESAEKLRRSLKLADDVDSAVRSKPKQEPRAQPKAPAEADFSRAENLAEKIRQRSGQGLGVKAAQKIVDYAKGPGREVYDDAVSDALKGAIQTVGAIGGLATMGPPGFVVGWLGARSIGKKMAPKVGQQILDAAQRYVKTHGADTAGAALLAAAALGEGDDESGDSDTLAASIGGLFFARRFAERALGTVGKGAQAAGKGVYRASEAVAGAVDTVTGKATEALGRGTYKAGRAVGEAAGAAADTVAKVATDEDLIKSAIKSGVRDPKRWLVRNTTGRIADKAAEYFGPRISGAASRWLEKRHGKAAQEVVDEAVSDTVEAVKRDAALLEQHSAQSAAMVEDVGTQIRAALNETAEQKARALQAFPQRIGGDPHAQRVLLTSAVDELSDALGKVSDGSTAKVAIEFANAAKEAIINARTARDRFRIGMQLTETLVHHTAEVGDSEMAKVFGAYADKMWEAMGQREVWMGERELARETKRLAKKRESIIAKISAGEKLGIAALVGSAAVDDDETGAALASAGGLLAGKRLMREAGTIPPKGKAKRADGPIGALAERDATPTNFYPNSNAARNEYGESMRSYREAQRADNLRARALEGELSDLKKAGLVAGGSAALALDDEDNGAAMAGVGLLLGARKGLRLGERVIEHEAADQIVKNRVVAAKRRVKESGPLSAARVERELTDEFDHDPSLQEEARKAFAIVKQNSKITGQLSKPKPAKGADFESLKKLEAIATERASQLLSPEAVEAISKYTGGSFGLMRALREGADIDSPYLRQEMEKLRPLLPHLDDAANALKIDNPTEHGTLFRGIRLQDNELNELLTRDDFRTASLLSTSFDGGTAERFARKDDASNAVVLRFLKADEAALAMGAELSRNPHEFEALLPKDAAFKVVNRAYGNGVHVVDLEQIRPASRDALAEMGALAVILGVGGAAGALAYSGDASAAEPEAPPPDDRTVAAQRILGIDQAATQRIRHTARVLAGLAKPPNPEGLTTALDRFGAEHDDPRAAFEERKAILQKSEISPALVYDVLGATLGDVASVSPELYQATAARLLDNFRYLRENLPPEVKSSMLYPTGMPPSESAMRDWATQWNSAMDQESVLDDIESGTVTHLQIDTLKGAHPDTYQRLRTDIIEEVGANFADIPTSTKMQLDILFQADGLAGPMFSSAAAAIIGEASAVAAKRKQPGPADSSAGAEDVAAGPNGLEAIRTSVTNRGA